MLRPTVGRLLLAFGVMLPCSAQQPVEAKPPVSMSHLHLFTRDVAAQKRFWVRFGGTPLMRGPLELIEFPDVYIVLKQSTPTEGTVGSVIDHLGFKVRDLKAAVAICQEIGARMLPPPTPTQAFCVAPDEIKVELTEDPALTVPITHHHVHYLTKDVPGMQTWYAKTFGAVPGKRGRFQAGDLPGVNLTFAETTKDLAGTKGRSLDHVGFEVKGLEQFCQKLEQQGVRFDVPYRKISNPALGLAFLTDPWGTYIELTEGLAPKAAGN